MWWSGMKSGCLELEWIGVGGTWLQLMCCALLCCRVPNFRRWGWIGDWRFKDDFVVKDKSWTRTRRRRIQVIEQEEDLRDKCSERTMSKINQDLNWGSIQELYYLYSLKSVWKENQGLSKSRGCYGCMLGSEVPEDETLTYVLMWFQHGSQTEVVPCGITTWLRGLSDGSTSKQIYDK